MFTETRQLFPTFADTNGPADGERPTAIALLQRYDAGSSFFLGTPERTLLGSGVRARLTRHPDEPMAAALRRLFADGTQNDDTPAIAVGALPFAPEAHPVLFIPHRLDAAAPLARHAITRTKAAVRSSETQERPTEALYARRVQQALDLMRQSTLKKVVLSRMLEVVGEGEIDQAMVLRNLASRNSAGYTFAVDLPTASGRVRRLIGASPELLLQRMGEHVLANPIAGTAPRSNDPGEDLARSRKLLHSAKDRHEHELVVKAVAETLRPYCRNLEVPPVPELIATARVWHLSTRIRGKLIDPAPSSFDLALALHPTPAVCGEPRDLARRAIEQLEGFDRGLFTGLVGWCDANGNGEWAVTIRCAEIEANRANLYAGAGIVSESEPWREVAETAAKFRTLLDALQGSGV
ncbi:isochorismate synthase [Methylomonas rosea]|uniref:isochorismate synthase n=1 Tax=Methylomonas rosea TaxID=2952227 RepID=A0ABT1TYN6_9GAMM|nr:isochorismate synthase [Methylomonas sp. WSC-7]MCQ8119885.1 isochorismate synthase [Methylomonas sp. WSC-7]